MRQCVFYGGQLPAHAIRSALGIEILLDFLRRRFDPPPKSFPDGSLKFLSPYTAYSLLTAATVCVFSFLPLRGASFLKNDDQGFTSSAPHDDGSLPPPDPLILITFNCTL